MKTTEDAQKDFWCWKMPPTIYYCDWLKLSREDQKNIWDQWVINNPEEVKKAKDNGVYVG